MHADALNAAVPGHRMLGPALSKNKAGRQVLPALSKLSSIAVFVGVAVAVLKVSGRGCRGMDANH